jgi:hypothetical protein
MGVITIMVMPITTVICVILLVQVVLDLPLQIVMHVLQVTIMEYRDQDIQTLAW